jgi:leader peptidase (prepilin peptidase)/N-methyltransferase
MDVLMIPVAAQLVVVSLAGACLGSLVNWAIYALAWNARPISPWSIPPAGADTRSRSDRLPILGWWWLRRETVIHGPGFWVRPLLLEIGLGLALAALFWWEVVRLGLIHGQFPAPIVVPRTVLYWSFASHAILLCWMAAASFIDIDEKIIPDEITVTGTLLALLLAAIAPNSLLPHVAERVAPPIGLPAIQLFSPAGAPLIGPTGSPLALEPVTPVSPREWPPLWGQPRDWRSLAIGVSCYWVWCFALAPRIWRGRRGAVFALRLIASRLRREIARPPMRLLIVAGTAGVAGVWWFGNASWAGLLTALIGLVGSGGIVWAVRLVGTAALRREAMGFGDVTLMMMIGTFLGWQACIIVFFISPLPAVIIGIIQFISRHDDVIPFGPFLCLAACVTVVCWAPIWEWAQPMFEFGAVVPAALVVCLTMLGLMLAVWQMIKTFIFGRPEPSR